MGNETDINWADRTFNGWIGCTKVSPACDNCYAAVATPSRTLGVEWGAGKPRHRTSAANWKLPLRWNGLTFWQCNACGFRGSECKDFGNRCFRCEAPGLLRARRRVFCASLSDWLDNEVPVEWLVDLLDLIRRTPNIDWLQLSKRIGNFDQRLTQAATFVHGVIDAQASRSTGVPVGQNGRVGDRLARSYLEGQEAYSRSLDGRHEGDTVQASARGDSGGGQRILASASDDRRQAPLRSSSTTGMDALQRAYSTGPNGESQGRGEAEQPAEESRVGDLQRAAASRHQSSGRAASRREGIKTPQDHADGSGRDFDASGADRRRNGQIDCPTVRHHSERSVANLPRNDLEALLAWIERWLSGNPPANVWIGATICNQAEADRDIPKLLTTSAAIHFLSIEPLLGPVRIREHWLIHHHRGDAAIDWVIAGGESGAHARPSHPDWFRSLRDQCAAARVAFFMKQMGGARDKRSKLEDLPEDLRIRKYP